MRKRTQLILSILLALFFIAPAKADIKIQVKGIEQKDILLLYRDAEQKEVRHDVTLVDGKTAIEVSKTISPFTKFTLVIKGFTSKSSGGYLHPTVVYFFGSQNSNIQVNIQGQEGGVLTYIIADDLNNSINKDMMTFNKIYNEKTKEFMKINLEMQKMRAKATPADLEGKEAIIAANKILKADPKYMSLVKQSGTVSSGGNIKLEYIQSNKNLLSSSFLWDMYVGRQFPNDSIVKVLVSGYPSQIQNTLYCKLINERLTKRANTVEGSKIEGLSGIAQDGKSFSLDQLLGNKFILIDFWGTWCSPCVKGMPHMRDFYLQHKDKIEFVSVCCNDKEPKWKAFLEAHKDYSWIHLFDKGGTLMNKFAIDAFPTKIILDKTGKVVYRRVGEDEKDYSVIEKLIQGDK